MKKRIAILQSNYIPWKGYFDLINLVDEFILYDDVQYTKNDWRNRNLIKTNHGLKWLTIPVRQNHLGQLIKDTRISDRNWIKKHWASLSQSYSKSKYFKEYREQFENVYQSCTHEYLSEINYSFITVINELLGIRTRIRWSGEFDLLDGQTERLIGICKQCNATEYLSGPAAREYFDENLARAENIDVHWMDYGGYREYGQLFPPFEHGVTILDLIFNEGPNAKNYMKSF
jgi:hypothetical protein